MTTLDDKLLGEKTHYYCSSDEEEEEEDPDNGNDGPRVPQTAPPESSPPADDWSGYSSNTGPKGVIRDFQKWKQLEAEKRAMDEIRSVELAKKLTLSCQTSQEMAEQKIRDQQLEAELDGLIDQSDPILQEYMRKRMEEMMQKSQQPQLVFGHLIKCEDSGHFLREIEQDVKVICHIYSAMMKECHRLNECFSELAQRHASTKFLSIEVNTCGMSARFEEKGCPAILIYKKGSLIGSFVTVTDEFGSRFDADDVESFLMDHAFLSDSKCIPELVTHSLPKFRDAADAQDDYSDDE